MPISSADVMRIMTEQIAIAEDSEVEDHREFSDAWATDHGIEKGTMAMICNGTIHAFDNALINLTAAYAEQIGEDPPTEVEFDGETFIETHPGVFLTAMEMTITTCFRWGFEVGRQIPSGKETNDEN